MGNFGDGRVTAFDPSTGSRWLGQLRNGAAAGPVVIEGLWALRLGTAACGGG